jgi:hypothetical protein
VTRALLHALHVGAWALCYGAITYTYFRLNVQMRRFARSDDEYEGFAAATADGLQWWTFGSAALAAVTGVGLALWKPPLPAARVVSWSILVGVKTVLLVALIAVQSYISLVMWPRRAHAPRASWPSERRWFYRAAFLMGFLLLCELVIGAVMRFEIIDAPH